MPGRPDLTELERLLAECNRERERADRGVYGDFGEIEAWDNLVGACVHALPFLLAEARRVEALQEALVTLRSRASSEPLEVDVSDYGDEWVLGFLAGQVNALDEVSGRGRRP